MANVTSVQLLKPSKAERVWLLVAGPDDIGQEVERLSLDIPVEDVAFMERLAAYRNVLALVSGKRLKIQWSRKSIAESFIGAKCAEVIASLREMTSELGDLPDASDRDAVEKYAKRVLAWDKRRND